MNNRTIIIIKKEKSNKTKPEKKEVNFKTINEALKPNLVDLVKDNDLYTERHIVEEFLDTLNWIEDENVQYPIDEIKELRSKLEEIIERISCFNDVLQESGEEL